MALARGVDLSSYQRVTSWNTLGKSTHFCVVKATESTSYVSSTWRTYFTSARAAGLLAGSYHFGGSSSTRKLGNATVEARHYADQLRAVGWRSGRDLPPVLDIEVADRGKAALTDWVLTFVEEVDSLLMLTDPWLRCGVYCNGAYYRDRLDGPAVHEGRWLWLASWPSPSGPWPSLEADKPDGAAIWQWTDRARVDGVSGPCDGNVARPIDLMHMAPGHYGTTSTPAVEEDDMPLSDADLSKIQKLVRSEVRYQVKPGDGAQRISGGFPPDFNDGAALAAYVVDVAAQVRALVGRQVAAAKALDALADGMEPTVRDAVREALAGAVVNVDVTVAGDAVPLDDGPE